MPTRTFIGLILLVAALLVASTPALLNPTADGIKSALVAAGVPGIEQPEATREQRERTGDVTNSVSLKGYELGEKDLKDTLPLGKRDQRGPGGRLVAGTTRTLLPGEILLNDPASPPVEVKGGVLLDGSGCPVFRASVDIVTLWKDPAQKQKYLDKAASADNPAACTALLNNRVAVATNGGTLDQPNAREINRKIQSNDLGLLIAVSFDDLLTAAFPDLDSTTGAEYRGKLLGNIRNPAATETAAKSTPAKTATTKTTTPPAAGAAAA